MKILAICGSPHKGNTYSVLKTIKEKNPSIDFKILMLNELNLKQCKGCYTCVLNGEENCPLKDDRDMIIKEMLSADGVILASPTYVNHISSLMKNFIDRIGYFGHRPVFFDKFAMVMGICGGFGAKEVTKYLDGIFTSFGFNVVSSLELQISTKSEREKRYNQEKINEAFEKFSSGIKKGKRNKPTMMQVIMFNMFKYVSKENKDTFKADYQYYKDKNNFYYNTKINFLKKSMAKFVIWQFKKDLEKNR
ncbi:MAG: NAD(P)H-dependent oxidoreductase [bacterium]|nr:NAD(P)H-dependent oxidoreductase [bacterium]